jgi:hypothetical protein
MTRFDGLKLVRAASAKINRQTGDAIQLGDFSVIVKRLDTDTVLNDAWTQERA